MKRLLLIIVLFKASCVTAQQVVPFDYTGYQQISIEYSNRTNLVKYIVPDKNYIYWEHVSTPYFKEYGTVLYRRGKKPANLIFKQPQNGFFPILVLGFGYDFIAYVYKSKVGYINSDIALKKFMGSINNVQEAILLALLEGQKGLDSGFEVNTTIEGGAYKITPGGYELVLLKYNTCPQYSSVVHLTLDHQKIIKMDSLGVYKKEAGCPIF